MVLWLHKHDESHDTWSAHWHWIPAVDVAGKQTAEGNVVNCVCGMECERGTGMRVKASKWLARH
jgi:hypothetical protein